MLRKLKDFFAGSKPIADVVSVDAQGQATSEDLVIATAVILVEMASADKNIAPTEAEVICQALGAHFGLAEDQIPHVVEVAIASRKTAGKIDQFVAALNEKFTEAQRQRILAMIWSVVLADEKIEKFEERFAKQMQNRFKLTDVQAQEARAMAEQGVI